MGKPEVGIVKVSFSDPGSDLLPTTVTRTTRASTDDALVASWLGTFDPVDSKGTIKLYSRVSGNFLYWMSSEGLTLSTLTVEDLVAWRDQLEGAPATRANRLAIAKGLLSYGFRTGYLRFDVGRAVKAPKVAPDPDARSLSEMQVAAMVHVARQDLADEMERPKPRPRYVKAARQQLHVILWAYYTACRVTEISHVEWADIHERKDGDFNVSVLGKGSQRRTVVLPRRVVEEIAGGDIEGRRGRIFPVGTRRLQRVVSKVAARARLRGNVSPHWLRHASASHAVDRGAPIHNVQGALGHSSLSTTGRYLHRGMTGASRYLPEF